MAVLFVAVLGRHMLPASWLKSMVSSSVFSAHDFCIIIHCGPLKQDIIT